MDGTVLITVFMPVYNSQKYLKDAIDSILNQSYKNFEFLIIDDGSTDSSLKIIESYNDERIRLVVNSTNRGIPYTRNLGLDLARGEFIAIMDSDDIAYSDRLEKQLNTIIKNNADIVYSNCDYIINNKIFKGKKYKKKSDEVKISLMFGATIPNPSAMIKKSFLIDNKIKYRDECIVAQDYALWVDSLEYGCFKHITQPLIAYRTGHSNISKKTSNEKRDLRKNIIDQIRARAINNNGFLLEKKDVDIILKCFSDPVIELNKVDLIQLKTAMNNLINMNIHQKNYNEKIFSNNIKYFYTNRVITAQISKKDKINLLITKFKKESSLCYFKNFIRIFKY